MNNALKAFVCALFRRKSRDQIKTQLDTDRMELDQVTIPVFEKVLDELRELGNVITQVRDDCDCKKDVNADKGTNDEPRQS